ncbi:hypothetical protein D3C86_1433840 [compost metagenome]
MFETPLVVIGFHGLIEQGITQVFFQVSKDESGFLVHDPGIIDVDELSSMCFNRLIFSHTANDTVH